MNPTAITFCVYIFAMLAIGLVAYRYTSNLSDYILGGRRIGAWVTALSAGASDMSGWLLMGLPGALFAVGLAEAWIVIGLVIGAWFNWYFVAGRLRVYTEQTNNALTLPDYFSRRFDDPSRSLRIIAALVILVFFTLYCASGMVAGARLFEQTFQLSYGNALILGAAATIIYVFIGGFLAVSWTDTVQATLMIFALLLVPIVLLLNAGGHDLAYDVIADAEPTRVDWFYNTSAIGIASLMAWGLGYMGQPHILARFMAAKNFQTLQSARRISMTWMTMCLLGAVSTGFFAIGYFAKHPEQAGSVLQNRETVFIALTQLLFNPWVAGVLLSAILAAVMSTLSCQLLVCSAALTDDFYKALLRPQASQSELVWFGRAMVLLVALVSMALASNPNSEVLGMVSYAWAGFGAAFGPVILLSLLYSGMTRNGALAGMLVGAASVILWHNGQWFGAAKGPLFGLYELLPAFVFSVMAILLVSRLQRPSAAMQREFAQVQQLIAAEK
jgi:sodium/proline symporter